MVRYTLKNPLCWIFELHVAVKGTVPEQKEQSSSLMCNWIWNYLITQLNRGGSRTAATSKIERFVAAVLDAPLVED